MSRFSDIRTNTLDRVKSHLLEAVNQAFYTIKNNKMRSGLVILGVMIGVTSLVGMVATISGLNAFIETSISGGKTPILSVTKASIMAGEGAREWEKRKNLEIDDAWALKNIPHVRGVAVVYGRGMVVKYKNRKAQLINVAGSNRALLQVQNINVAYGRYFTKFEEEHRRNVVVIGAKPAKSLFPYEDPIRKKIRLRGKEYTVIGVFEERKTIFGGLADNFMAVPYTSYQRDFMFRDQPLEIHLIVDDMKHIDQVEDNVRAIMRMRRKVPPGQPDDFAVVTVDAVVDFTKNITDQIALVLVVLSSIALMVGGIGVMVIMLVSVTERTREIGIRKSIGAKRSQITWQFLIEAATLSGIGGAIGIVVGITIAYLISRLLGFPFVVPVIWMFIAFTMSAAVGLFFGIVPARKAAKLDPIVALRYE